MSQNSIHRSLTKACCFLALFTFLAAITIIVLKSVYGITGINIQPVGLNCTNSYSYIKFSNVSQSLLISFVASLFAVISSVVVLIVFYVYFKRQGLIGNDQNNEQTIQHNQKPELKYELLFISSSIGHLAWIIVVGQLMTLFFQASNCIFSIVINKPILFVTGVIGISADFLNFILILILMGLRPVKEIKSALEDITFGEKKKSLQESSEISKKVGDEIKQYLDKIKKQKEQKQNQLLQYELQIYNSQEPVIHQQKVQNQQQQYSSYYQFDQISEKLGSLSSQKYKSQMQKFNQITPSSINQIENDQQNLELSHVASVNPAVNLNEKQEDGWQNFQQIISQPATIQPISEQICKLLKITLFNNSPDKTERQQIPKQNPLKRLLDRDSNLDVVVGGDPNSKRKMKKSQQSRVQLVYQKNRKLGLPQSKINDKLVFTEYEKDQLIKNRPNLIGKQRSSKLTSRQQQRYDRKPFCYKKFNIIEYVRCKYS